MPKLSSEHWKDMFVLPERPVAIMTPLSPEDELMYVYETAPSSSSLDNLRSISVCLCLWVGV